MLQKVLEKDDSEPFSVPVDPEALKIPVSELAAEYVGNEDRETDGAFPASGLF